MAEVSMRVVIGIDGGGTKTEAVALDQAGQVLARGAGGPANVKAVGREAAAAALATALVQLTAALPPAASVVALHAALAGAGRPADIPLARALLAEICSRPELKAWLGGLTLEQIGVSNDALAVLAAADAVAGVVVIAGTGSFVWGCDAAGATARAGGWGYLLGDEGSGYDLGRRALAAVLAAHDGRAPATALTAAVLDHFGLEAPPDLVDRVYGSPSARSDIAGVALLVLATAEQGDATAQALTATTVRDLAAQAAAVVRRLQLGAAPFPVVCSGGLFQSEALYHSFTAACAALPGARCQRPARPAAEGAALLAWSKMAQRE